MKLFITLIVLFIAVTVSARIPSRRAARRTSTAPPVATSDCWTCGPGWAHWWEFDLSQPTNGDRCQCIEGAPSKVTTGSPSPTSDCWTCGPGWSHWWEFGLPQPTNGDRCQCIEGVASKAPGTSAPATTTKAPSTAAPTNAPATTTTTRAPSTAAPTTKAPSTTTKAPTATTTTKAPTTTTTTRAPSTAAPTTKAPSTTTKAPTTTTKAPTTTTTRAPTTTTRAPTTTTKAPSTAAPAPPSSYPSNVYPLNATMIALMVSLHNQARANVNPPAKTMPTVSWDNEIAEFAIAYATKCQGGGMMSHNPSRKLPSGEYLGENIWASTAAIRTTDKSIENAVRGSVTSWDDEAADYNYASNSCKSGAICGHYTQVVWANSVRIGCALVRCNNLSFGTTILCNYGPGGNYVGQKPYVSA